MTLINPATEQAMGDAPVDSDDQVRRKLAAARKEFGRWRSTGIEDRALLLRQVARRLREQRETLAKLMAGEMGKPVAAGEAEIDKCALTAEWFADNAARMLGTERREVDDAQAMICYEALGPILAIMPWNFPFWQLFRFAAPALMAGNVVLMKHAANVPGCAAAIEGLFSAAGCPAGVFTNLYLDNARTQALIADPAVAAVTLTGSTRAGRAVAAEAGKALKKCVLELGGSDPFIVLDDVDVPAVARQAANARVINSGQSCIAAKRFIVLKSIYEQFEKEMTVAMARLQVGDPMDRNTAVGPLARLDLLTTLHEQVIESVKAGARLVLGGARLPQPGYFYAPTILADVKPGMKAFDEETFGPVAALIVAEDEADAIRLANASSYGLGASVWTSNPDRARRLIPQIESGVVFVNEIVKSDPRLPFGGVKHSGFGRELAEPGIREFVNIKTVWIAGKPSGSSQQSE